MNNRKMQIWDREFDIKIIFDCYEGEEVLPGQKEALNEFNFAFITNNCLQEVKDYVRATAIQNGITDHLDNIFRYVVPRAVFVQRNLDNIRRVALLCDYKFDPDDGIAVVFENGCFAKIGKQDIIL